MNDLIAALQIFAKYMGDESHPTWCEHDVLHICCAEENVSNKDIELLEKLGFFIHDEGGFASFKFGSC